MCRVLRFDHSGFYAWLNSPLSSISKDDRRQLLSSGSHDLKVVACMGIAKFILICLVLANVVVLTVFHD